MTRNLSPTLCRAAAAALWLATLSSAPAQLAPELALLGRIKYHMAQTLSQIPNYTCLQTIERSRRRSPSQEFRTVDTIRVEVALVGGKELFSWPGAGRFEEKALGELVAGGTTTTGDYAIHARTAFLSRAPTYTYVGEEVVRERRAVRYDFRVAGAVASYKVQMGDRSALVPHHGSFWVDPETLDLIRLEVRTDEIPPELQVAQAITDIDYEKVRVGASDFLLPQKVEFVLRRADGSESRNRTEFTGCRQYVGESVIHFEERTDSAPNVEKPITTIELPAGLSFETRLQTEIDSTKSVVGDSVVAIVGWPVKKSGKTIVPKGAELKGRIRRLEAIGGLTDYFVVGVEFSELRFGSTQAAFFGELERVGLAPGIPSRQIQLLRSGELPGVGTLFVRGPRVRLPQGLRLLWKTVPPR